MASGDRYFCLSMMRHITRLGSLALVLVLILTGCTINRDIMFRTSTDYKFDEFVDSTRSELRLQTNDMIQMRLFANDGFKMIDLVSEGGSREAMLMQRASFNYFIESDGLVKLPLLGRVRLSGLTIREAELFLEGKFVTYYNKPFVQIFVNSRRVVVFPGGGGDAKSIMLENNNTTLLEVIGLAGGLSDRANARKVKLFRYAPSGKRLIYQFDLRDIEGLKYADMVMQGDDVVYVQPNPDILQGLTQEILPIVTLVTSIFLLFVLSRNLR